MAQGQQQQQGGADAAYTPVWIIAGLFGLSFFIWKMYKVQIVKAIFFINLFQARIISFFSDNLANDIYIMQTIDPKSVTVDQLLAFSTQVGAYTRFPVMAILLFLSIWLYFTNVALKFKKNYSMNTLREQEQQNWHQIMPVTKLDIVNEDVDKGPWAMALTPMEFAKKHNLLKKDDFAPEDPQHPGVPITAGIKRGEAKTIFILQLGSLWRGFEVLPIHYMALAAVCCARISQDRDGASQLLKTINESVLKGKISFLGAKALLKKHVESTIVQETVAIHAYNITALASLLTKARQDGVLPTCDFLWLKTYDRRLWYMLNSVGRQTPFVEVGGVFAHWKAEKAMGRRSVVPMVDEAIKALEEAVKEIKLPLKELREL